MSAPTIPGRLGTIATAAERLAANPKTVRRMIARGQLIAYRLPGTRSVRVDLDQLDAILRPIPATVGHATDSRPVATRGTSVAVQRESTTVPRSRATRVPDEAA